MMAKYAMTKTAAVQIAKSLLFEPDGVTPKIPIYLNRVAWTNVLSEHDYRDHVAHDAANVLRKLQDEGKNDLANTLAHASFLPLFVELTALKRAGETLSNALRELGKIE